MDIAEPKEPEKKILRALADDIAALVADPENLVEALRTFSIEAGFDVFTPLERDSHPNVQYVGQYLFSQAVQHAHKTALSLAGAVRTYIGEIADEMQERRLKILSNFLMEKDGYKKQFGVAYDDIPDEIRILRHFNQAKSLVEGSLKIHIMANSSEDFTPEEFDARFEENGYSYPLIEHPDLLGMAYIHINIYELLIRHEAPLHKASPDFVNEAIAEIRSDFMGGLSRPQFPETPKFGAATPPGTQLN